jgi:hypothetical protein
MVLLAEQNDRASATKPSPVPMTGSGSRIVRITLALALMAAAANCFLKYLWWAACYSAWYGLPKFHEQWKKAGANASFNGWSVIVLELSSMAVMYTAMRLRSVSLSPSIRTVFRVGASLTITIVGTGLLALALAWIKQSH